MLLIEAKEIHGKVGWEYACGRFSDWELHVQRKDKEVFSSVPSETNTAYHDPLHLYRTYPEKVVTLEGTTLWSTNPANAGSSTSLSHPD